MDAWEALVNNSSVANGDAWGHLKAQEGGELTILTDEYQFDIEDDMPDLLVDDTEMILEIDDGGFVVDMEETVFIMEMPNE